MKAIFFSGCVSALCTLFSLVCLPAFGQGNDPYEQLFNELELELSDQDTVETSQSLSINPPSASDLLEQMREVGLEETSEADFRLLLDRCREYRVAYKLRDLLEMDISKHKHLKAREDYNLSIRNLERKRDMVDEHLRLIVRNNYLHYHVQATSKQWIKGIHLYHENDFFLFSPLNADRDYTGGFRLELMTDWFKMRLFKSFGNDHKFLSYQSIFIGGEGYTPYIRFTEEELKERKIPYEINSQTGFFTDSSLVAIQQYMGSNQEATDRPFASFQYIGRAKYRLHHRGFYRMQSLFKLGTVGGNLGNNIQAVIHQDLTTGSQRVLNWDKQIANGGRLAINVEHQLDISLLSKHSLLYDAHTASSRTYQKWYEHINVYIPVEAAVGTVQTYWGLGLGVSNKSFLRTSGINDVVLVDYYGMPLLKRMWQNSYVGISYHYRNVVHNSMLEGVGIFKPFQDDPLDDEAMTTFALREADVNRHLHTLRCQVGIRLRRISLYYRQTRFINREFRVKDAQATYDDFTTPRWYGFGTVGVNFLL